jgi:hypothetical protein
MRLLRKVIIPVTCITLSCLFCSFAQTDFQAIALNFVKLLNEGKFEDAAQKTTTDFKVNFRYAGGEKSKDSYFFKSRAKTSLHSVTTIDSSRMITDKAVLYVHTSSDLNTYVHLPVLRYRYAFSFSGDTIKSLLIDSMPGYNDSLRINDKRWNYFERWAQSRYPGINITYIKLQYSDSLSGLIRSYDGELKKKRK